MKKIMTKLLISIGVITLVCTVGLYIGVLKETERLFRTEGEE